MMDLLIARHVEGLKIEEILLPRLTGKPCKATTLSEKSLPEKHFAPSE